MAGRKYACLSWIVLFLLTCPALIVSANAQDAQTNKARAMYTVMPPHLRTDVATPATSLQTWNGSFTDNGTNYSYNMVGAAPSTNSSVTITTYIIPVKIVITNRNRTTTTFDPSHVLSNGSTVTNNTLTSPLFDSTTTYTQGGVDLGTTQYIDAFQRGNFWGTVSSNTGYHLLLGAPKVLPLLTLNVPSADGKVGTEFGVRVGLADINWFDAQLQSYITAHTQIYGPKIRPDSGVAAGPNWPVRRIVAILI